MSNTEMLTLISYTISFVIFVFLNYNDYKDADNCIFSAEGTRCRRKRLEFLSN